MWITGKYCRGTDGDPISLSLGSWLVAMRALDLDWEEGSGPLFTVNLMLHFFRVFYSKVQYTAFFVLGTLKVERMDAK